MIGLLALLVPIVSALPPTALKGRGVCVATSRAASDFDFDLGRAEATILTKADLRLTEEKSIDDWERQLNQFFERHRHDPDVHKWVDEFILEFTNRKEGDYVPGDWALQRKITDWRHFFLQQAHFYVKPAGPGKFELVPMSETSPLPSEAHRFQAQEALEQGTKRRIEEGPDGRKKEIVPELELRPGGLYSIVENTMKVQYQVQREVKGTSTNEGVANLRRIYLQQTLLKEAYLRWRTSVNGN